MPAENVIVAVLGCLLGPVPPEEIFVGAPFFVTNHDPRPASQLLGGLLVGAFFRPTDRFGLLLF